jgi:phospholipid-binding lipoprotein MlaA
MWNRSPLSAASVLALGTLLCACVTLPANAPRSKQDPWESFNRGVYRFNDSFDRHLAKPLAKGYVKVVPHPIRTGVNNFFTNLNGVTVMLNDALQGKLKSSGNDLGRLVLNTTVGIGGILDPATSAGLDKNDNDFGRTLGVWGLHPGPFVELPIFGPSDVRDVPGKVVDSYTRPGPWLQDQWINWALYPPYFIDLRASLLPLEDTLKNAYDPYAVIRDAYLARRAYLTGQKTGNEDEPLVDPDAAAGASEPLAPAPTKPAPPAPPAPPASAPPL